MATNFKCPRCRKIIKVGRLRAKYTCPLCNNDMIITRNEKMEGRKIRISYSNNRITNINPTQERENKENA